MALSLEQDVVRGLLGGWRTREAEPGALAREFCLAMARIHLVAGHDVCLCSSRTLSISTDSLDSDFKSVRSTSSSCCSVTSVQPSVTSTRASMTLSGLSINAWRRSSLRRRAGRRTNMRACLDAWQVGN